MHDLLKRLIYISFRILLRGTKENILNFDLHFFSDITNDYE